LSTNAFGASFAPGGLMKTHARRLPAPWFVVPFDGGLAIEDAWGQRLAFVFYNRGDDDPSLLCQAEAVIVAQAIASLPGLIEPHQKLSYTDQSLGADVSDHIPPRRSFVANVASFLQTHRRTIRRGWRAGLRVCIPVASTVVALLVFISFVANLWTYTPRDAAAGRIIVKSSYN
jgi:hypothetical protein